MRNHFLRIDDHFNLARVGGLHFDNADAGDPADHWAQHVIGLIAQIGPGNIAIQDQAEHRKNCGAYALNLNIGIGGQFVARLR